MDSLTPYTANINKMEFIPAIDNYDKFLEALVWSYTTSNPNDSYPNYQKQVDNICSGELNSLYIQYFLNNGLIAQEGLLKYIKAISNCARYGRDDDTLIENIKLFIQHGASIENCTEYLMKTYDPPHYLEDFADKILMRMKIVDAFWEQLDHDHINSLTDWKLITPAHWENIVYGYDVDEYDVTSSERENTSVWFYMYMKYASEKLKNN